MKRLIIFSVLILSMLVGIGTELGTYAAKPTFDAINIKLGVSRTDRILTSSEEKKYVFQIENSGRLDIHFKHSEIKTKETALWDISLMNEDGVEIATMKAYGYLSDQVMTAGVSAGKYYIVVEGTSAQESLNQAFTLELFEDLNQIYESEPNSNINDSNEIKLGTSISARMSSDSDDDYFLLKNASEGRYRIQFEHEKLSGIKDTLWEIKVMDENGSEYDTILSKGNVPSEYIELGLNSGDYYILVTNKDGREAIEKEYEIRISKLDNVQSECEFNDCIEEASSLDVKVPLVGTLNTASDKDYYKLQLFDNQRIKLSFDHSKLSGVSNAVWNIKVMTEREQLVFEGKSKGNQEHYEYELGLRKGIYYVLVEPATSGDAYFEDENYVIAVYDKPELASNTEFEFNNDEEESNLIKPKQKINGSISTGSDIDFYNFAVNKTNANVKIIVDHKPVSGYDDEFWRINIYNEQQQVVDSFTVKGNKGRVEKILKLNKGKYYISIQNIYSTIMDAYGILVEVK